MARVLPLAVVVDCWIGVIQETDRRVIRLAGRLSIAHVPELLGTCADAGAVELDLTELVSADVAGIDALRRVRDQGAHLTGTPGYIKIKLDSPEDVPAEPLPRPLRRQS